MNRREFAAEDFEEKDGLREIAALALSAPAVAPPEGLTGRIMAAIPAEAPGPWVLARRALLRPRRLTAGDSGTTALCFIAAAFFQLVTGLVLMAGLHGLDRQTGLSGWFFNQPEIALVTAALFLVIGFHLLADGPAAWRMARAAVVVYLGFVTVNAFGLHLAARSPLTLAGGLVYAGWGVAMGVFLYGTVRQPHPDLARGRVR